MLFPAAILLVNNDLTLNVQQMLINQLDISEVIDGNTYDARLLANPSYVTLVHNSNIRLLVIRSFTELNNRNTFDVIGFIKAGMISVLPFGHCRNPGATYPIVNLTWAKLLNGMKAPNTGEDRDEKHRRIFHDDTQNYNRHDTWDLNHLNNDRIHTGGGNRHPSKPIFIKGTPGAPWQTFDMGAYSMTSIKTNNYTASYFDLVRCDPTSGGFTIFLPTAVGNINKSIIVKNVSSSINSIIIDAFNSETIDGSASVSITVGYEGLTFVSDGSNWVIV